MKQTIIVSTVIITILTACSSLKPIPTITPVPLTSQNVITVDNAVTLVELADFRQGDMGPVTALAFTPDKAHLRVVHAGTPVLRHWNISDQSPSIEYTLESVGLGAVAFDKSASVIAMTGVANLQSLADWYAQYPPKQIVGPYDGIHLLDTESGQRIDYIDASGSGQGFYGVSLNQNGHIIATQSQAKSGQESKVLVFERTTDSFGSDTPLFSIVHHQNIVGVDFALDGEGRLLAVHDDNNFIHLWEVKTGQDWGSLALNEIQSNTKAEYKVSAMAIAPTRQWLAAFSLRDDSDMSESRYITIWQLDERHIQWQTKLDTPYIHVLAFSPTGELLAGGSSDGVHIWNVATGEEIKTFPGESTFAVTFSPDGSQFAWGDQAGVVHLTGLSK